jgi:hypothetical protein
MEHPRTAEEKVELCGRPEISHHAPADEFNNRVPGYKPINLSTVSILL